MRLLSYLTTFLMAVLLAACGGGGGSPGLSSGSVSAFSVVGPSTLTLQVGLLQQYSIQGGVKPYSVYSTDPAVAVGWLEGENVLKVGSVAAGKATITAVDAKGSKFDMAITAGSSTAFYTTAPTALTIAPGAVGVQTFKMGGGTPPYKAVSSFPSALTVSVNGSNVTFTALQTAGDPAAPTAATVTMSDSSSPPTILTSTITIGTVPLAVTPNKATIYIGDMLRAIITGGTPPYRTLVGIDESLLSARIVNGNQLEAVGGQVAEAAVVQIIDSNNVSVPVTVKITNGQDVLRISPNILSLPESTNTPNLTLMVYGASATGSLQVFSSDSSILKPGTPVQNSDGTGYSITLTGGNTCSATVTPGSAAVVGPPYVPAVPAAGGDRTVTITVMDAKGKLGTSTITVKDSNGIAGC